MPAPCSPAAAPRAARAVPLRPGGLSPPRSGLGLKRFRQGSRQRLLSLACATVGMQRDVHRTVAPPSVPHWTSPPGPRPIVGRPTVLVLETVRAGGAAQPAAATAHPD
eukprot:scaffold14936_cov89-Isochrysis_galbana.AAC.1